MLKTEILKILNQQTTYDGYPLYWSTKMIFSRIKKTVSMWKLKQELRRLRKDGYIVYTYWRPPCLCYEGYCECGLILPIWGWKLADLSKN